MSDSRFGATGFGSAGFGDTGTRDTNDGETRPFGLRILGSLEESPRTTKIRVQVLLSTLIVSSNVVGVVSVFILAAFVIPGPRPPDITRVAILNVVAGLLYTTAFVLAGLKWGARLVNQQTDWLYAGRTPTEDEQRVILQLPLIITGAQSGFWLLAAFVFAAFNAALNDHITFQVGLTILLGGLLTAANSYVVGELLARPLAARALASGPPARLQVPGVRARAILAWLLSCAVPTSAMMVIAAAAITRHDITRTRLAVTVLALGGAVLTFGLRITAVAARANADPIKSLRRAFRRVEEGDLDVTVPIYDGTEIGQLQAGFNRMVAEIQERERIREVFEHHVGEDVARSALEGDDMLGGEVAEAGVLFVDIVGSTGLAGRLPPDEVVALLNSYFAIVVDVVAKYGGSVNKFEGDGALAVFGAPTSLEDPAGAVLAAGRALAAELSAHSSQFEAGIGISAGPVVAGNIGAPARYEYTVIGDPVNEAARLTDLAKGVKGRVLASWTAVELADTEEAEQWSRGREVSLRGRPGRTRIATPVAHG
jgi:adenylate cyclase